MKARDILDKQLEAIRPSDNELEAITESANELILKINKQLKGKASAFIGGSLAKNTLIRKERYDIDIFVRFSQKYSGKGEEMSNELEKMLKKFAKCERIHGSRDYFHVSVKCKELKKEILFEIVPVLFINKPRDAENVTDLSFFHVAYVRNAVALSDHPKIYKKQLIKNKRFFDVKKKAKNSLNEDIRLAKSFCYSQGFYGAESHIQGFSGYALELLVIHYGGFFNLLKNAVKWNLGRKIVIDPEKHYKTDSEVLSNINESKLQSPIIFVDPTFKERNVCASVSKSSFLDFISSAKRFLKSPSMKFFEIKKINTDKFKETAKKKKAKFSVISASIKENVESVAASKLFKFYNFLLYKLKKENFALIESDWAFFGKNKANFYIVFKLPPKKNLSIGPPVEMQEFAKKFRAEHKKTFIKNKKIYAYSNSVQNLKNLLKSMELETKAKEIILSVL